MNLRLVMMTLLAFAGLGVGFAGAWQLGLGEPKWTSLNRVVVWEREGLPTRNLGRAARGWDVGGMYRHRRWLA